MLILRVGALNNLLTLRITLCCVVVWLH